jgi:hypothetical protein
MALIRVINPNSNPEVTRGPAESLSGFAIPGGREVARETLEDGPFGIESQEDIEQVVLPLLARMRARPAAAHVRARVDPLRERPVVGQKREARARDAPRLRSPSCRQPASRQRSDPSPRQANAADPSVPPEPPSGNRTLSGAPFGLPGRSSRLNMTA